MCRQTEINKLEWTPHVLSGFQHPIFELEIAMTNAARVQKGHRREHFGYSLGCKRENEKRMK
jgi:hypothetical protein